MLIIPLTGKLSWRNPPFVTIGIILINCLVYFLFQTTDTQRLYEAHKYYFDSGLAQIEMPRYFQYLEKLGKEDFEGLSFQDFNDNEMVPYYRRMNDDSRFTQKLRNDRIVRPADPEYDEWKVLRQSYEQKLSQVVALQYGFRPAYRSPITFLTYMFLHGSVGHLLGNMLFLWIVGCALEMGYGRLLYPTVYVTGGLLSVGLYWLVNMQSTVPLVGASGAIAGLMGAFTLLFRMRKINIFYSLGFYFNYVKIPAIVLLPVWIGNELYQLFFGGVSHVAYVAHIGGLLSGALLGFLNWKYLGFVNNDVLEDKPVDEISPLMESALERLSELDLETARRLLEQVLQKDPGNIEALTHLFNIAKNQPEQKRLHRTVRRLLSAMRQKKTDPKESHAIYREYVALVRQPRLSPDLYLYISTLCAVTGDLENAKRILTLLLKHKTDLAGIPTVLLKLADAYRTKGKKKSWHQCLQVISKRYPDSPEARIAQKALNG